MRSAGGYHSVGQAHREALEALVPSTRHAARAPLTRFGRPRAGRRGPAQQVRASTPVRSAREPRPPLLARARTPVHPQTPIPLRPRSAGCLIEFSRQAGLWRPSHRRSSHDQVHPDEMTRGNSCRAREAGSIKPGGQGEPSTIHAKQQRRYFLRTGLRCMDESRYKQASPYGGATGNRTERSGTAQHSTGTKR